MGQSLFHRLKSGDELRAAHGAPWLGRCLVPASGRRPHADGFIRLRLGSKGFNPRFDTGALACIELLRNLIAGLA